MEKAVLVRPMMFFSSFGDLGILPIEMPIGTIVELGKPFISADDYREGFLPGNDTRHATLHKDDYVVIEQPEGVVEHVMDKS